jgi:hypothetical protein
MRTLTIPEGFNYSESNRPNLVYLDLNNDADWGHYYDSLDWLDGQF